MSEYSASIYSCENGERRLPLNFSLEDTNDGSYRDISNTLIQRGWNKVPYRKRSKLERRRLPTKQQPMLICTIADKDIDYAELLPHQIVNHFEGISSLTTKRGFCELLREGLSQIGVDRHDVAPRSYNLGDPLHRDEFIEDFRISACINVLKWAVLTVHRHNENSRRQIRLDRGGRVLRQVDLWREQLECWNNTNREPQSHTLDINAMQVQSPEAPRETGVGELAEINDGSLSVSIALIRLAVHALARYLRVHGQGDWPGVGVVHAPEGSSTKGRSAGKRSASIAPTVSVVDKIRKNIHLLKHTSLFNSGAARINQCISVGPRPLYGSGDLHPRTTFECHEEESASDAGAGGDDKQSTIRIQSNICGLTDAEWQMLLDMSYAIAEQRPHSPDKEVCIEDIHSDDILRLLRQTSVISKAISPALKGAGGSVGHSIGASQSTAERLFASPLHLRMLFILRSCAKLPQLQFDISAGMRNVWIVKAPDASCGLGLRLLYRLGDILEAERGVSGRTCQKYLEDPLLYVPQSKSVSPVEGNAPERVVKCFLSGINPKDIPDITHSTSAPTVPAASVASTVGRKFDLRVWVLVTSFFPLKAYVYNSIYGRACSFGYSLQVGETNSTLSDPGMHFTNYSVQSKLMATEGPAGTRENGKDGSNIRDKDSTTTVGNNYSSSTNNNKETIGRVKSLRGTIDTFRDGTSSAVSASAKDRSKGKEGDRLGDLLLSHAEVVAAVESSAGSWTNTWAAIRDQILQSLLAARLHLPLESAPGEAPRQRHAAAFEFLGYDIILDARNANPHLLEVNLSPGMARRNPEHAAMIAHMCRGLVELAIVPYEVVTGLAVASGLQEPEAAIESYQEQAAVRENILCGDLRSEDGSEQGSPASARAMGTVATTESVGQWEPLHRSDDIYHVPSVSTTFTNYSTTTVPAALSSDWTVGRSKRPSSAGFRGRSSTSGTSAGMDIGFILLGKSISPPAMAHIDTVSNRFERLLLLQRWARRYAIDRSRVWRLSRERAAIVLQLAARRLLFHCHVRYRARCKAATILQCMVRCWKANKRIMLKRHQRATLVLQCAWRVVRARRLRMQKQLYAAGNTIFKWYRSRISCWHRKHAFKIVIVARRWLDRRAVARRTVRHLLKWNMMRRRRWRNVVHLFLRKVIQARVLALIDRRRRCKGLADVAAAAGRDRILARMERARKASEQRDRCIAEVVNTLITEDLFGVSIKDMWDIDSTSTGDANMASRGAKGLTLGVTLAVLARQSLHEERAAAERRRRADQEVEEALEHDMRLRAGVIAGLRGSIRSGLGASASIAAKQSSGINSKSAASTTDVAPQDIEAERRQRRLAAGEHTRQLLSRAYGVLNDQAYQQYKSHLFYIQDSTHSQVSAAVDDPSRLIGAFPALPVILPTSLFAEYLTWEQNMKSELTTEARSRLLQSAQSGRVVLFNGRVIDTGRFQAPVPPVAHSAIDAPPKPTPQALSHASHRDKLGVGVAPSDRHGLQHVFVDDIEPASLTIAPPPTARPPRPRSASAQRATTQPPHQSVHQEPTARGRAAALDSPRAGRYDARLPPEAPLLQHDKDLHYKPKQRKKRPSSAGPTSRRSHSPRLTEHAEVVLSAGNRIPAGKTLRNVAANDSEGEDADLEDLPASFGSEGHWEPYGFVGSFGGASIGQASSKTKISRRAKVKKSHTLVPSVSPLKEKQRLVQGRKKYTNLYDAVTSPEQDERGAVDDDRALLLDRSRMLANMLKGLGFSER